MVRVCGVVAASLVLSAGIVSAFDHHGPGISYLHKEVKEVPWSIHIVKVDRHRSDLHLACTLGQGATIGMGIVSDQVKSLPPEFGKPVAAINGDFFKNTKTNPGDPEGVQIMRGELVSAPLSTRSCFWVETNGSVHITNVTPQFTVTLPDGSAVPFGLNEEREANDVQLYTTAIGKTTRTTGGIEFVLMKNRDGSFLPLRAGQNISALVRSINTRGDSAATADTLVLSVGPRAVARFSRVTVGNVLRLSTATQPDMSTASEAIGGGPALVRGGKIIPFKGVQPRHPRSAIGWNDDTFFLVEVDGRQSTSAGMTLPELADYMAKLGCREALNLDGGGSATLWVYGNVMNSPSEGRERPAANAIVVVQDKKGTGAPPP
jgi:hypothetical protein